jgi:hypothetical protein
MAALHLDAPVTRPVPHHLGGRHFEHAFAITFEGRITPSTV